MKRLAVLVLMLALAGCVTTHTIPPGCEKSIIHAQYPWADTILSGAVIGCYVVYSKNPELYAQIQEGAKQAIILLQGPGATYAQLSAVPNLTLFLTSQLSTVFRPDQMIDACDREILKNYLKMI